MVSWCQGRGRSLRSSRVEDLRCWPCGPARPRATPQLLNNRTPLTARTKLGKESISSELHQQISYEAALQGQILLKNNDNTLPLRKGSNIAVVGPMALDPSKYLSSYAADEIWYAPHSSKSSSTPSWRAR